MKVFNPQNGPASEWKSDENKLLEDAIRNKRELEKWKGGEVIKKTERGGGEERKEGREREKERIKEREIKKKKELEREIKEVSGD